MHQSLTTFSHWLQNTPMALTLGHAKWGSPLMQLIHVVGLFLWVGTSAAVDLRLLGMGKEYLTADKLSDDLFLLNWGGLAIAILGGFLLFSVAAGAYIANPAFEMKLGILIPLGLLIHILIRWRVRTWSRLPETPVAGKVAGALELLVWLSVIAAGMAIQNV